MLVDFSLADAPRTFTADVCVVGAGAAGVTLARSLSQHGHSVCLLESGGLDFDSRTQSLYEGANIGMQYYPLEESRLRFLGGTTNIWGGRCVPHDPIDFRKRAWVPHSSWPIGIDDLQRYYRKAHDDLELGKYSYDEALWQLTDSRPTAFNPDTFASRFWRFDERQERFGASGCDDIAHSSLITLVLHANVVHIQAAENGRRISRVDVKNLEHVAAAVTARYFVLACGAVENARLLLAARDVQTQGLGNTHDQVGRYFMEHPHGRLGTVETTQAFQLWSLYRKRFPNNATPFAPALVSTEAQQERLGILNSAITFKLQRDPARGTPLDKQLYLKLKHELHPNRSGRRLWYAFRRSRAWLQRHFRSGVEQWRAKLGLTSLHLIVRAEQAPNPSSRVCLSERRDALGCLTADLDWQLGELDKLTVRKLAHALDEEYRRLGLGRVKASDWLQDGSLHWPIDQTVSNHPIGGYHHMGTTRMSACASTGVVDADCRVHELDNLFVAGSSVFATGGWANPTLTILALVHRLGDHLSNRLKRQ